jgi:hypothetical protein
LGKVFAKLEQAAADSGFDRAERFAEPFGDLLLGQAAKEGQFKRLFLIIRQRCESSADNTGVVANRRVIIGPGPSRILLVSQVGRRCLFEQRRAPSEFPQAIDRPVSRQRDSPGKSGSARGFEAIRLFPKDQENIVDDILGFVCVAEN